IGYQHGYLLGEEIADLLRVCKPYLEKTTRRDWNFYRQTAEQILWPKIEPEYQQEIDGIVSGLKARGKNADRWDIVALNALEEVPYYYSRSIDDFVRIMLDGNNGGYANDWLIGDRKTGEIALFELGLKNH